MTKRKNQQTFEQMLATLRDDASFDEAAFRERLEVEIDESGLTTAHQLFGLQVVVLFVGIFVGFALFDREPAWGLVALMTVGALNLLITLLVIATRSKEYRQLMRDYTGKQLLAEYVQEKRKGKPLEEALADDDMTLIDDAQRQP